MKQRSKKDQELTNRNRLARAWRAWHREQLNQALAGVHRDVFERLMAQLKDLRSARQLIDAIAQEDWSAVDADTRLVILHEINNAITRAREKLGLAPIDDPLLPGKLNAFQIIRSIISTERPAEPFGNTE